MNEEFNFINLYLEKKFTLNDIEFEERLLNTTLGSSTARTLEADDVPTINIPYTICECIVALLAVVGNAMVIIVFKRERRLRRRTNYYIVSLAIADFLVGLLGVPFAILASIGLPSNLYACLFSLSLLVVLCTISIFCLVAVSIDRYWAILHPMAYSRNVRTKTAICIIACCWFAGGIVGFLPLFGLHQEWNVNGRCYFVKVMSYDYLVFLYFATIITPSVLLAAFYAHIYRVIIRQVRQIVTMNPTAINSRRQSASLNSAIRPRSGTSPSSSNGHPRSRASSLTIRSTTVTINPNGGTMLRVLGAAQKREVKATQNLSIIVLFFMICWIPLYTINCIKAFCRDCDIPDMVTFFCIILSHLNSAVNPILYAYHLRDFRAALKNFILKMCGMGHHVHEHNAHPRISHASQQQQNRLHSLLDKRPSPLHQRIYVDSPVWLRSQQQRNSAAHGNGIVRTATTENGELITLSPEHNNGGDGKHNIWRIVEIPSTIEEHSKTNENSDVMMDKLSNSDDEGYQNENCDSEKSSNSAGDNSYNVFATRSATSSNDSIGSVGHDAAHHDREIFSIETHHHQHDSERGDTTTSSREEKCYLFPTDLPFCDDPEEGTDDNLSLPASLSQRLTLSIDLNKSEPCSLDGTNDVEHDHEQSSDKSIFLIEKTKSSQNGSKSKVSSPKIIPSSKYVYNCNKNINRPKANSNLAAAVTAMMPNSAPKYLGQQPRNSCSSENIHKPSPLKTVGHFIFPPHSHSNIFNMLDRKNVFNNNNSNNKINSSSSSNSNRITHGANTLKRTLSDS